MACICTVINVERRSTGNIVWYQQGAMSLPAKAVTLLAPKHHTSLTAKALAFAQHSIVLLAIVSILFIKL
jgi:hypothetical protein